MADKLLHSFSYNAYFEAFPVSTCAAKQGFVSQPRIHNKEESAEP